MDYNGCKYMGPMISLRDKPTINNPQTKHPQKLTVKECKDRINSLNEIMDMMPSEQQEILKNEIRECQKFINEVLNEEETYNKKCQKSI